MHGWERQREPEADAEQQAERSDEPFALLRAALERHDEAQPGLLADGDHDDLHARERDAEQL